MKKTLLLLTMLVGCISTLWADGTITVTSGNAMWTSNEGTYTSNKVWTSNAAGKPTVTITGQSQKNAQAWNTGNGVLMCNTSDGLLTLTIAIAGNYRITGFSITAKSAWNTKEVRFSSNGQDAQGMSNIKLNITGLYTTSTTLTAQAVELGDRAQITDFVVNYTEHTEYISNVEADIKPYMDAAADQLFCLTSAGQAAVTAAGYDPAATTYTEAQYNAMLTARNANICYPETGTYIFKNKLYPEYYMYRDNAGTLLCSNARTADNAAYMITLIKTGDNVYRISAQGKYVGTQSAADTAFPCNADDAGGETFSFSDVNSTYLGLGCLVSKNSNVNANRTGALHCSGSKKVVNWNPAGEASWWTITPATSIERTFDESGYLTLNYPFNIEKPSGVEFYDATGISAGEVTMTAVSGDVLAANHPVIAYRSEKAGTVAFNITTDDGTAKPGTSILEGTLAPASPADASTAYILVGTTAADTRFAKLDEADATISANRAYLSYAGGGSVRELGLNFGVTAIKGVAEGVQKQDSVFDLQGRRVEKPSKGLYIVNGKKVLF